MREWQEKKGRRSLRVEVMPDGALWSCVLTPPSFRSGIELAIQGLTNLCRNRRVKHEVLEWRGDGTDIVVVATHRLELEWAVDKNVCIKVTRLFRTLMWEDRNLVRGTRACLGKRGKGKDRSAKETERRLHGHSCDCIAVGPAQTT